LRRIGEIVPIRELVIVTLKGLPSIWETFIYIIINNDIFSSFDEIVGNLTQEESRMISRGRIQNYEKGEKKERLFLSSLITRAIKEKEVHQVQESFIL